MSMGCGWLAKPGDRLRKKARGSVIGRTGRKPGATFLFHDEQVVEAAQEEVSFFRGFAPVAFGELLVVADHRDDVHGLEAGAQKGEELEADGHEDAGCSAFLE